MSWTVFVRVPAVKPFETTKEKNRDIQKNLTYPD